MENGVKPSSSDARMPAAQENPLRIQGQVKWFDFTKGYGFITRGDGGGDILLHQACVRQSGFKTVQEGATVVCEAIVGSRGLQASLLISLDNRQVMGINPWIKPLKFALSGAIYWWSLAWVLTTLPVSAAPAVRWIGLGAAITIWVEIVLIWMQAARGTTSHFNVSSAFDGMVFSVMGIFILINTLLNVWALALLWRTDLTVAPAVAWGIRLGLLLFILGAAEGGLMAGRLAHTVGGPDGGPGLPGLNWSTRHGDLRIAHFVGMHALQGLPLVGWLVTRLGLASVVGIGTVAALAIGWAVLTTFVLLRALNGVPMIALR